MEVPLLISDFINRAVKLYGPSEAVVDGDERWTYAEFGARANQLGHGLAALGVGKGDRVGILSPNSHHFLEAFYGVASIGAVIVPMNYRLIADDFDYIINHVGAKVMLVDSDYTAVIDELRPKLPTVEHFVVARFAGAPLADGWRDWEDVIAGQSTTAPPDPGLEENDLYSINYTSGTTARPKGVMLTHRNIYLNAYNFLVHSRISNEDVEMWTLPMFHANGWGGPFALTAVGARHVVLRKVDPQAIYQLLQDEEITFACMAPAVLAAILDYPDRGQYHVTTKPRFVVAGAPPPLRFIERLETELGWEFVQGYGLTETSPLLTLAEVKPYIGVDEDGARRIKVRAGHDIIGVQVRVVDADGNDVPADDAAIGEVIARSNVVFKGYWEQPEETAKVIVDGWFHTGDLATVDAHGYINLVDRAKDMIITGGENVSSIEVEDVLYGHPAVLEAAVIGVPSERWGETPLAVVVLREGAAATAEEIIAHCRDRMAHFKAPTRVEFVAALPRTATGKLKKFELRETHWQETGAIGRRIN